MEIYRQPFDVAYKSDKSPVTIADNLANQMLLDMFLEITPDIPVISEEIINTAFDVRRNWSKCWIIDPLDGTKEFVKHTDEFTINIALIDEGKPVFGLIYAPALQMMYYGEKGKGSFVMKDGEWKPIYCKSTYETQSIITVATSRSHPSYEVNTFIKRLLRQDKKVNTLEMGSSLKLCLLADGTVDVYPRYGTTMEWDIAAGHAIIEFAGRQVLDMKTNLPLVYNKENLENPYFIAF
jgi:3'(2'), 5'-bisphosphate nucleotidase